jgi:hypothetical protein
MSIMRTVIRGGAVRFLAGIAGVFAVWYPAARFLNGISFGPARVVAFLNLSLCLAAGYVATLGVLGPTLHAAQGIESRRSVIAGCFAMCFLLLIDWIFQFVGPGLGMLYGTHASRGVMELIAFLVGASTTVVAFKSWLKEGEQELEEMMDAIDRITPSVATAERVDPQGISSERVR